MRERLVEKNRNEKKNKKDERNREEHREDEKQRELEGKMNRVSIFPRNLRKREKELQKEEQKKL